MTPFAHYRVLVADDHEVVRSGIRALLESQRGIEVCGEAANGAETIEYVKAHKPDLVLLDLVMPEMNGIEVARMIRQASPESDVVILSMHFSEMIAQEALRVGARGYILKSDAHDDLLMAIEQLRQGKTYFTRRLEGLRNAHFRAGTDWYEDCQGAKVPLSHREIEILQMLAEGNSNKQVAASLGISTRTVETHRSRIMHKMSFSNYSELIRFAIRNNLLSP